MEHYPFKETGAVLDLKYQHQLLSLSTWVCVLAFLILCFINFSSPSTAIGTKLLGARYNRRALTSIARSTWSSIRWWSRELQFLGRAWIIRALSVDKIPARTWSSPSNIQVSQLRLNLQVFMSASHWQSQIQIMKETWSLFNLQPCSDYWICYKQAETLLPSS